MQLTTFSDYKQFSMREQREEFHALAEIWGANFTDCLRLNNIKAQITVINKSKKEKAEEVTIKASQIYNTATWEKFLAATSNSQPIYLADNTETLTTAYITWLTTNFTERYQSITTPDDRTWLYQVARLAVRKHILENKYAAFRTGNSDAFIDERVYHALTMLHILNQMAQESAKAAHHTYELEAKKKDIYITDEQQEELQQARDALIKGLFDEHYSRIEQVATPLFYRQIPLTLTEREPN